MKSLIFFITVFVTMGFSAENIQINWKNDLNEIGTHGHYRAEWTNKVILPAGCQKGVEQRLDEIVLVSRNVLNKKPSDWLSGKYLQYVNTSCDIWGSLRGTPEDFEKIVDQTLKFSELGEKEKYKVFSSENLKKHEETRVRIEEEIKTKNAENLKKHEDEVRVENLKKHEETRVRIEEEIKTKNAENLKKHEETRVRNVEQPSKVVFLFMAIFVILAGFYLIRSFLWGKRN